MKKIQSKKDNSAHVRSQKNLYSNHISTSEDWEPDDNITLAEPDDNGHIKEDKAKEKQEKRERERERTKEKKRK